MLETIQTSARTVAPAPDTVIKLAILAVGGQGGGVLSDWIVETAELSGYVAQSTSVAGVAQRTGATIYYIEMAPDTGRFPIFSLSPAQGDVDIMLTTELMEAGRAIMRGFVTPDRTTLITSSHRIPAVSEKIVPGDGRAPAEKVTEAARTAARQYIAFDMEAIAQANGTMISASLLGALAGSGALPFPREAYEHAIQGSGRGAAASLAAFGAAFDRAPGQGNAPSAVAAPEPEMAQPQPPAISGPAKQIEQWNTLMARVHAYPAEVRAIAELGLRKVVDYQDLAYGKTYLDGLDKARAQDDADHQFKLTTTAAKYLANAMCYDDILRVADLKTRSSRSERVRKEVGVKAASVLQVTEYFHPRIEEICGTLPRALGSYIENRPKLSAHLGRLFSRGRRVRTDTMTGFGTLWMLAALRPWRRSLLRHSVEEAHLERWYALALDQVPGNYDLAVEILACRRLIKGYSDTHSRSLSKYDRVISALPMLQGREDAADWLRRLREAALKDEEGHMLDGALKTVASL